MEKHKNQLGINYSTARNRLNRLIFFNLVVELKKNICFRCKELILDSKDLTVDHKINWLHSENSKDLFFDMDNVAFSHARCNYSAARCRSTVFSSTGFKGVSYNDHNKNKPYLVRIKSGNKVYFVGRFSNAEEAAKMYDKKAIEVFGDRAVTNFDLGLLGN